MFRNQGDERPYSPFTYPVSPPDADPLGGVLVKLAINQDWLAYVRGACLSLIDEGTWNTDDPAVMELTIRRAYDLLTILSEAVNEPPFYDSDQDASDEQLPAEPWYETVSDWVISAFLAVTFTPGAAIVYRTTIPKLRLAFRTGDMGAIVRVLLNDIEVWTGSTHSPEMGQLVENIDAQAFATAHNLGAGPWTLKIVNGGAPPTLQAVRGLDVMARLEVELGDIRPGGGVLQLRQSGCLIQSSADGETWTTLYDPTDCVGGLIGSGIQNAIDDGTLSRGGTSQPGPGSGPQAGQCKTHHVKLAARDVWLCPSPVNSGDTVQILNATGGWFDGEVLGLWRCPDGHDYALGTCGVNTTTETGDPINTLPHMMVVGHIVNTFFNPTTPYTVPNGTVNQPFYLQANDSVLTDNEGSVEFDVEVCAGLFGGSWEHSFGFATGQLGWTLWYAGAFGGSPAHFGGSIVGGHTVVSIFNQMATDVHRPIHVVRANIDLVYAMPNQPTLVLYRHGAIVATWSNTSGGGATLSGDYEHDFGGVDADFIGVYLDSGAQYQTCNIFSMYVSGDGSDPFAS